MRFAAKIDSTNIREEFHAADAKAAARAVVDRNPGVCCTRVQTVNQATGQYVGFSLTPKRQLR